MPTKFKIIKSKAFKVKDADHTHYTVAYKGRVFGVSTLRFEEGGITAAKDVLTVDGDIEVTKNVSTDALTGEVRTFLDIVPKMDISLATF